MKSYNEDFNKWCDLWDKAQKELEDDAAREPIERKLNLGGFFGLTQADNLDHVSVDAADEWRDVIKRTNQLFDPVTKEEFFTEERDPNTFRSTRSKYRPEVDENEDGIGKDLANGPGKDVHFNVNPTHFASAGVDQKLRVAKNWTDGKELVELAKMKSLLYALESDFLHADCLGEKTEGIQRKLAEIQNKCSALSEKLTPDPKTDVV